MAVVFDYTLQDNLQLDYSMKQLLQRPVLEQAAKLVVIYYGKPIVVKIHGICFYIKQN